MPIGDQHRGGVAVAMAVLPGGSDQPTDLGVGEVLARADLGIALAARRARRRSTVPITVAGATSARCGFVMTFQAFPRATVPILNSHGTLRKARNADLMGTTAILGAGENRSACKRR